MQTPRVLGALDARVEEVARKFNSQEVADLNRAYARVEREPWTMLSAVLDVGGRTGQKRAEDPGMLVPSGTAGRVSETLG